MKLFDYLKKSLNTKKNLINSSSNNKPTSNEKSSIKNIKPKECNLEDQQTSNKNCFCFDNYAYGSYATKKTN